MFKKIILIVIMMFCFVHHSFGEWDTMGKTENYLNNLNSLTKQLTAQVDSLTSVTKELVQLTESNIKLSAQIVALTESNKESSEKMESLTETITFLTWVLAGFAALQILMPVLKNIFSYLRFSNFKKYLKWR